MTDTQHIPLGFVSEAERAAVEAWFTDNGLDVTAILPNPKPRIVGGNVEYVGIVIEDRPEVLANVILTDVAVAKTNEDGTDILRANYAAPVKVTPSAVVAGWLERA